MERYEKYKDSGIDWIGEIPEHWEIVKFSYLINFQEGPGIMASDFCHTGIPLLRIQNLKPGFVDLEGCNYLNPQKVEKKWKHFQLKENDLLISSSASTGLLSIVDKKAENSIAYTGIIKLNPADASICRDFIKIIVSSNIFFTQIELLKTGTTIQHYGPTHLRQIKITRPPLEEQKTIALYLDRKTAEIDQLIAQKERLIELYEEEKTAIINQAVTKGINPDVKLKPSGIDWLGDIPEHWQSIRLKFLTTVLKDGTHGSFKRVTQGYRLLSVRNIQGNYFVFRDDDSRISEEDFLTITKPFKVQSGDIQLAIVGATLGKVAIVPKLEEDFATQRSVATIRTYQKLIKKQFIFFFFKGSVFQNYLWHHAGFSAQPGVYLGTLENCHIAVPPLKEQKAIADYIETETARIDAKIGKTKRIIELQKEYCTALISEAVTGKIKVPQLP